MKNNLHLVERSVDYKEQFLEMVAAYKASVETDYFELYREAVEDFDGYVFKLLKYMQETNEPDKMTPSHSFWLTNDEQSIIGVIRIRTSSEAECEFVRDYAGNIGYDISPLHRQQGMGKLILKLGLEKAKSLGLDKVLITCFLDNPASIKVIEDNGGILESEALYEKNNKKLRRYWIKL